MMGVRLPAYADPLVAQAIEEWDRLLRANPPSLDDFVAWQQAHHLVADAPLCRVLRPGFVTKAQLAADGAAAENVFAALVRAGDRILAEPAMRQRYLGRFWEQYAEFLELEPGASKRCLVARLDAFPTERGLMFLENNVSPGGILRADESTRLFEQLAVYQSFTRSFRLESLFIAPTTRAAILSAYKEWGGKGLPRVAALRPQAIRSRPLRRLAMAHTRANRAEVGIELYHVDPQELTFEGGRLRHGEATIDLVLRGFMPDLLQCPRSSLEPLFAAIRARAVCVANSFNVYGHKALFAAITDPACELGLSSAEQEAARQHVPWTRLVLDEKTTDPSGAPIELLRWAIDHREDLVLKPTTAHGGEGILLGHETNAAAWAEALETAQRGAATHILQTRVQPCTSPWPLLAPGMPEITWIADRSPFLAAGRMAGYYLRLSQTAVTNVSRGGSIAPTFVLGGRA